MRTLMTQSIVYKRYRGDSEEIIICLVYGFVRKLVQCVPFTELYLIISHVLQF